jgi:hypothetical protein
MERNDAYLWLAGQLGIDRLVCHISLMDRERAMQTATLAAEKMRELRREAKQASPA